MDTYTERRTQLDTLNDAELRDYYAHMAALAAFAAAEIAVTIDLVTTRASHIDDGAHNLTSWIQTMGHHHHHHTARREAAIAAALTGLPHIWAAYNTGELSTDQVHELCRFATADTDAHWAETAPGLSAAALRTLAAQHHSTQPAPTDTAADTADTDAPTAAGDTKANWFSIEHEPDCCGGTVHGWFDTTTLALIEAALIRQAETYGGLRGGSRACERTPRSEQPDGVTGEWAPRVERYADAARDLVLAAKPSTWADRATSVVHIGRPHRLGHPRRPRRQPRHRRPALRRDHRRRRRPRPRPHRPPRDQPRQQVRQPHRHRPQRTGDRRCHWGAVR